MSSPTDDVPCNSLPLVIRSHRCVQVCKSAACSARLTQARRDSNVTDPAERVPVKQPAGLPNTGLAAEIAAPLVVSQPDLLRCVPPRMMEALPDMVHAKFPPESVVLV